MKKRVFVSLCLFICFCFLLYIVKDLGRNVNENKVNTYLENPGSYQVLLPDSQEDVTVHNWENLEL